MHFMNRDERLHGMDRDERMYFMNRDERLLGMDRNDLLRSMTLAGGAYIDLVTVHGLSLRQGSR